MTDAQIKFIEQVAPLVQKYAPQYGIKVCSPIIAQAILESGWGTSAICKAGNNYFGLKWRDKRLAISNEYVLMPTQEQNADGSYITIQSKFCKFRNLEESIIGYFQFTNTANYANLKGVTDPETYLTNIKADKYATSLKYVENNMRVVNNYGLTKYDTIEGERKMVINVHAGHNPDGKIACGAVSIVKESTEARKVKDRVIKYLTQEGHTVHDCTVNDGTSQSNVLSKIVEKCNSHTADLDVSIHFNAGAKDLFGNKKTTGTEAIIYSDKNSAVATRIVNSISSLGFTNRGVKINKNLYVLRKTKAPAVLVECCFVDDKDDCDLYEADVMAKAIAEGILGKKISEEKKEEETPAVSTTTSTRSKAVGTNAECPFVVKCLDHLNIRETAGGKIVAENGCRKGTKYTITKVSGNWGYLKSGKGWISILSKYVTRN